MPGRKKRLERKYMSGRTIEPIRLRKGMSVQSLMEVYGGMGFNARRLYEAAQVWAEMIREDATICLTLAGAMTPVGMSGALITLMEKGWVDWIISTGANLYHDLHRAFDFPMKQGHFDVDDEELKDAGIARIYDVFIEDDDTMLETDRAILASVLNKTFDKPLSTAAFHARLGREVLRRASHPRKSFVARAVQLGVPIYVPSPGDSSIGMNLVLNHLEGRPVPVDPTLDILETAAIVRSSPKNGAVMVGGGAPKNFFMQTQPTLWQILEDSRGGHDYFVQITADAPHWGGLSGATASEARSWGKVKDAKLNNVTVYADASFALPIIVAYLLSTRKPRKKKNILQARGRYLKALVKNYEKNHSLRRRVKKVHREADLRKRKE
jgi:deoxyhypusine synthase